MYKTACITSHKTRILNYLFTDFQSVSSVLRYRVSIFIFWLLSIGMLSGIDHVHLTCALEVLILKGQLIAVSFPAICVF